MIVFSSTKSQRHLAGQLYEQYGAQYCIELVIRLTSNRVDRYCHCYLEFSMLKPRQASSGLNAASEEIVRDIFCSLDAQRQTLIVVTHDIHVGEIAHRLISLANGRVLHSEANEQTDLSLPVSAFLKMGAMH